jgi:glycosyltransferase involved in cell wall biosynthesis
MTANVPSVPWSRSVAANPADPESSRPQAGQCGDGISVLSGKMVDRRCYAFPGHGYSAPVREYPPPRVSVLIGCWNNAATLRAAAESILGQTLTDLELIIVDDGSTDATPQLVDELRSADSRVRYLPLAHIGISASLNAGLGEARGDLVAFQDADDWSLPARLQRELDVFERRPEVTVVGCRMREVDAEGVDLEPRTKFTAGDVNGALMSFNPIPNSCAMVRRLATVQAGGFDVRYRYAMDYDLWLRLAERGTVVTLDDELAVRVMGGQNVAAQREREQIREAINIRLRALRRRRTLKGAAGLMLPLISLMTPLKLKRVVRRRAGQAP